MGIILLFIFFSALVLSPCTLPASAGEHSLTIGSEKILIEASETEIRISVGGIPLPPIPAGDTIVLGGTWSGKLQRNESAVSVSGNATVKIELDGVDIRTKANYACAFEVRNNATVALTLSGDNTLKSGVLRAGLEVKTGNTVIINGTETGRDTLTVQGGAFSSGIGSAGIGSAGTAGKVGTIVINGGIVTATGGISGAGIGGASNSGGGIVAINGGTVTATGGQGGLDIGPGNSYGGMPGTITITGGSVHPTTDANAVSPQPTDGTNNVYLNTLTVGSAPVADKPITACSVDGQDDAYGVTDIYTDGNGAVYFWLTEKVDGNVTAEADGNSYSAVFTRKDDNTTEETLVHHLAAFTLDMSGGYDFGSLREGYAHPPAAYTVTIENTGSAPLRKLSVGISGGGDSAFVLTHPEATLDIGGSASFKIQPKGGLPAGPHIETVTLSAASAIDEADIASRTFDVSFTVSKDMEPGIVDVEEVKLDLTELTLALNSSHALTATVSPDDASDATVTWSSSDPGVAAVSQNGLVTALSAGTAAVTVTTNDGGFTATCVVTVTTEKAAVTIDLSALNLEDGVLHLKSGQSVDLTIATSPAGAALTTGDLPDGLALSPEGRLAGTAGAVGSWPVNLTATLPDGSTGDAAFIIKVSDQAPDKPGNRVTSGSCTAGLFGMGGLAILALALTSLPGFVCPGWSRRRRS